MKFKSIKDIKKLKEQRVLVRCDLDVPLKNGQVVDDARLQDLLPTLHYLIKHKARIILVGHLGRPHGKRVKSLSLLPVYKHLAHLLGSRQSLKFVNLERYIGPAATKAVGEVLPGNIILLENLRFSDREEKNCKRFAKALAGLADIYINNSFANSHRKHASIDAVQSYLPSYLGLDVIEEIKNLIKVTHSPKHPLILIIGGAKIATKLPVIKSFTKRADYILLGGGVANTFLASLGFEVGKSLYDKKYISLANKLYSSKIILPVDAKTLNGNKRVDEISKRDFIGDIGPASLKLYLSLIATAKTIIWNGPLGKMENPKFKNSTLKIAQSIIKSRAKVVVGGGDTDKIFKHKKIPKHIFISSGGGAMLEFLASSQLPGIKN